MGPQRPSCTVVFSEPIGSARLIQLSLLHPDNIQSLPLFTVEYTKKKPHVIVSQPATNHHHPSAPPNPQPPPTVVAEMSYHSISSRIEVTYLGQSFTMKRNNLLSSGHHFHLSPLPDAQWDYDSFWSSNLKLVTHDGQLLARYKRKYKSLLYRDKTRAIEISAPEVMQDRERMNAIVITGLAAATYRFRSDNDWYTICIFVTRGVVGSI